MLSLTDFIARLPGVKPRKTRALIMDGDILTKEQKRDIFFRNNNLLDTVYLIGPDAAEAVLKAYRADQLPMDRGESVRGAPQAEQYLEMLTVLGSRLPRGGGRKRA